MSAIKNKLDLISELFCQTNLGGGGENSPFGWSTEKPIPFSFTIGFQI